MASTTTQKIRFAVCPETPKQYQSMAGHEVVWELDLIPGPGTEGTLLGIPGRMLDGYRWEIRPVDMRDDVTKLLDQADALLEEPQVGDRIVEVQQRVLQAQFLLLQAQSKMLRQQNRIAL